MLSSKMTNLKWNLMLFFGIVTLLVMGGFVAVIVAAPEWLRSPSTQWMVFGALFLVGMCGGYFAAIGVQRNMDSLHLAIIELKKGNLAARLPAQQAGPFQRLFADFNGMAEEIEDRMRLLQKTGEENVRLQIHSSEAAVIEERKRLARDLHDTVSQHLFAIHMSASSLPKLLERKPEAAAPIMEQLVQMSHHAQKQIRGLIAQLRPIELEGVTLIEGLNKWFPDYCRQNGLQGRLELQLKGQLSDAIEHQLFLIVQEGMANVVKHASAGSVVLSLHDSEHQAMLVLEDDGQGFAKGSLNGQSYGLTTMRERAQKLGGDLEVTSRPGAGTALKVKLPKFATKRKENEDDNSGSTDSHHDSR